uniref:FAD dependent oxidoreductase domain-containing protein n=1 Tax=Fagus sylvatica TaxID=28930 RepID=A0A2N9GHQ9_FAGSY
MALVSSFCCPNPNPISPENGVVSYSKRLFSSSRSLFLGSKLVSTKTTRLRNRPESVSLSGWHPISASCCESFDVVIIGAGIIGLTIARQLLIGSELSVAVVEKAVPCSGATGAGMERSYQVGREGTASQDHRNRGRPETIEQAWIGPD